MAMARSVSVRYTASMGALLRDLGLGVKANEKLAAASDKAAARVQANASKMASSYKPTAQAMRASLEDQRRAQAKFDADQAAASDAAAEKSKKNADRMAVGGLVIAAGLGMAIAKFAEFDAQMSAVGAATGKTGGDLDSLRDAAVTAGAATQYSATEAASAITELSKAGLDATDILGGGLTGALNLAAAGQMGVADAAETMATALAQFHLDGGQASHVADLLAAGAGKAQGSVDDMGQALKQAGLVAANTGLSIDETTAGLTAFANAGLIGSDAGTSMKTMLQRLTPQSDQARGMMDDLGISAYDAGGNFIGLANFAENLKQSMQDLTPEQRNAAMSIIFGSDAVRGATVLYNEGSAGIDKWTKATGEQGFAARQAATLTDNLKGDVERLGGALDTALIQGGSGANDVMRTMTQTAEGLVQGLAGIPGPVAAGSAAIGAMLLLGPKVGNLAKNVTGPLSEGMQRFRDEMKLQEALATTVGRGYDALGEQAIKGADKVSRSSVRMGAAKAAIGGIKGAAGGLMSALGGPWGIALAGATVAVGLWAQKQAEAQAAADALNGTIDKQTDKFTAASTESVLSSFAKALSPEDLKRVQDLGINLSDVSAALLEGGPRAAAMKDQLKGMADERAGVFGSDDARLIEALLNSFDSQAEGAAKVKAALELLRQEKNNQLIADSRQADSAASAERNTSDLGVAADGAAGSMDAGAAAADGMSGSLKKVGGEAKDAKDELDGLMTFIDQNFGSGERALRAGQRAFNKDVRDASDAAKEAAKAGTKGYADPEAVKAQKKAKDAHDKAVADLAKGKGGGGPSKGATDRSARADQELSQAREHQRRILADAKSTAAARESAANRVAKAELRAQQAQAGLGSGTKDLSSLQERVQSTAENLADANQRVKDTWHDATEAGEKYQAALEGVAEDGEKQVAALIKQNKPIKDVNTAYENTREAMRKVLKERGIMGKAAEDEIDKIFATSTAMNQLRFDYANTQAQQAASIKATASEYVKGVEKAKKGVKGYWEVINGVPMFKPTTVTTPGADAAKGKLREVWTVIDGIPRRVDIEVSVASNVGAAVAEISGAIGAIGGTLFPKKPAKKKGTHSAAGNIVTAYAAGGLDAPNSHVAEIATGGVRMWAEPETQGEGYVPLADDWRRPRAKAITQQIVSRFGGDVTWHAAGSITAASLQSGGVDVRALAAAMAEMPRSDGPVHLHAHSLDIGDGLRRASRDFFWERDHRR